MASIIRNAKVVGGTWSKSSKGYVQDASGKVVGFGIVNDDRPTIAPELFKHEVGAQKTLAWLRANSSSRGIIYRDDPK